MYGRHCLLIFYVPNNAYVQSFYLLPIIFQLSSYRPKY
jgi:hypothetical protein